MRSRQFTMQTPLWGMCRLVPRECEPVDGVAMGYVVLEGDSDNLKLAIWKRGQWLDHRMRAFPLPVSRSYAVEKADGTPIF